MWCDELQKTQDKLLKSAKVVKTIMGKRERSLTGGKNWEDRSEETKRGFAQMQAGAPADVGPSESTEQSYDVDAKRRRCDKIMRL